MKYPFPNRDRAHVFECPHGHVAECGDAGHHPKDDWREWKCSCSDNYVKMSCPPACRKRGLGP